MAKTLDVERLKAAIIATEKKGPLASQDQVWSETASRYNSGEGLPKKFQGRPEKAITKAIVYQAVYKRLKWDIKTPKKKSGRPNLGQPKLTDVLDYLEKDAVAHKWRKSHEGWASINKLRENLGFKTVEPIDKPTADHFKID